MKKILGLDLGTNSIGWAVVEQDFDTKQGNILGSGSRIIPMPQDVLDAFGEGNPSKTQTSERTRYRSTRKLYERAHLRRERLHRVLNVLGFLPEHYSKEIDFEKRFGKFLPETEPKLAWQKNESGKYEFLFKNSFEEMIKEFREAGKLQTKENGEEAKIPYDWTIYYLRNKALTQKIEKEELAWLILNFNQKRGYYQLRGEEEDINKSVEFHALKVLEVTEGEKKKDEIWYNIKLENDWIYRRSSKIPLFDWKDKIKEFIVTTDLNADGSVKKRSFRAPNENDWALLKKKTEVNIEKSKKFVGTYIYENLLQNPTQKIIGKLVRTIERKFYKDEFIEILKKQVELQPELFTNNFYNDCIRELYKNNTEHQTFLASRSSFVHLFVNDIIFYQRPLKSKKSSIRNCELELRIFKDKKNNNKETKEYLKAIPKSNPLYQEFRIWQWLYNLKIYTRDSDIDVTDQFIKNADDSASIFDFLMTKKEVSNKDVILYLFGLQGIKGKSANAKLKKYRWNYVFDNSEEKEEDKSKKYPCNETGYEIRRQLEKVKNVPANFLTMEIENKLWHIIYSVTDKAEFEKALKTFAEKQKLDVDSFVENFKNFKPFNKEYGSFSKKAIKKLLPLMRLGKYWKFENIDTKTQERIEKIIIGEYDEKIKNIVREKAINLTEKEHFQGLQLWLAQYIVYNRHSESGNAEKWESSYDIQKYLYNFKQHSLRNPIVEQVITETLRVVKDIWEQEAEKNNIQPIIIYDEQKKKNVKSYPNFFDEIHIELVREMKNTAESRRNATTIARNNENTNLRIKALLMELKNDREIENVRPYSPTQQEILKIYEEHALQSEEKYDENTHNFVYDPIPDDILKISKTYQPSKSDLERYKLWLEQRYRSPYTGQPISLSKLFTSAYEIEHIIPKSRYFDDSFNNKVICEAEVNNEKNNLLGLEFIQKYHGKKVQLANKVVEIFSEKAYKEFVEKHYDKNKFKKEKLLLTEIPEEMIARQMNDSRYISKFICSLLSNIVRENSDDDGVNSKNLIPVNGKITGELRQDWGLNDVWNILILPRFERMNELKKTDTFTTKNQQGHTIPNMPFELQKGFQKKRIDHRHHAMDALVIACATRNHINLLNNANAHKTGTNDEGYRYDLKQKLIAEKQFIKPWKTFTQDVKGSLENIIVSFKQNLRVINKTTNKYESYKDENGNLRIGKDGKPKKDFIKQTKGDMLAIRKPLHKGTFFAKVEIKKIKKIIGKVVKYSEENSAVRKSLDISFDKNKIKESVTDTSIQKILLNYLIEKENKPEIAFSPEGIEEMNKNIVKYNDGKKHQPILKVRVYEKFGNKFVIGKRGNKKSKFAETEAGTNLFFAIYTDENGKRIYETIPLNKVIERLKKGESEVSETNKKGNKLLFCLSPNDLVYVPTEEEKKSKNYSYKTDRIYKMVSTTENNCMFVRHTVSMPIVNKVEYSPSNKMERAITGEMIKDICIKLKVDRLGKIEVKNYLF